MFEENASDSGSHTEASDDDWVCWPSTIFSPVSSVTDRLLLATINRSTTGSDWTSRTRNRTTRCPTPIARYTCRWQTSTTLEDRSLSTSKTCSSSLLDFLVKVAAADRPRCHLARRVFYFDTLENWRMNGLSELETTQERSDELASFEGKREFLTTPLRRLNLFRLKPFSSFVDLSVTAHGGRVTTNLHDPKLTHIVMCLEVEYDRYTELQDETKENKGCVLSLFSVQALAGVRLTHPFSFRCRSDGFGRFRREFTSHTRLSTSDEPDPSSSLQRSSLSTGLRRRSRRTRPSLRVVRLSERSLLHARPLFC